MRSGRLPSAPAEDDDEARRTAWSRGIETAHRVVDGRAGATRLRAPDMLDPPDELWSNASIGQQSSVTRSDTEVDDLASLNGRLGGRAPDWSDSRAAARPRVTMKSKGDATVTSLVHLASQQGKMERDIELMRLELEAMHELLRETRKEQKTVHDTADDAHIKLRQQMQSLLKQQAHILDEKAAAVQLFGQVRDAVGQLSRQQAAFEESVQRVEQRLDQHATRLSQLDSNFTENEQNTKASHGKQPAPNGHERRRSAKERNVNHSPPRDGSKHRSGGGSRGRHKHSRSSKPNLKGANRESDAGGGLGQPSTQTNAGPDEHASAEKPVAEVAQNPGPSPSSASVADPAPAAPAAGAAANSAATPSTQQRTKDSEVVTIKLPDGVQPGQQLKIKLANGITMPLTVPVGAKPGQHMQVRVDYKQASGPSGASRPASVSTQAASSTLATAPEQTSLQRPAPVGGPSELAPPAQMPPAQMPPAQMPPAQMPPAQMPPAQMPPAQ
eukprot:SAG31_NODE_7415_length_1695_cov_2.113409_1_plen_498_part_10